MRLLPYGPAIRLVSRELGGFCGAKVIPALYSRPDWNCGRRLDDEEKRCGITLTMSSILKNPWKRRAAVVKSQISDTQVNEVIIGTDNANEELKVKKEEGAFLQKCPKGRWRKISRQKTILIEDSQHSTFGDPEKSFYPRVQAYGKYVRRIGCVPPSTPILKFTIYREGIPLSDIHHRLEYELGIEQEAIHWNSSPTIGSLLGVVSQHGYAVGVSKELLPHASRHYNLNSLIFDPVGYMSLEEFNAIQRHNDGARGYFYRLLLRCVDVEDTDSEALYSTLKALRESGFINYFGLNHFGIGGNPLFEISRLYGRGQLNYAIGSYMQLLAEKDPYHYDFFMNYVNAFTNGTAAGIAKLWKDHCLAAKLPKQIIHFLDCVCKYTSCLEGKPLSFSNQGQEPCAPSLEDLWNALPHSPSLFDRSASEFIWNTMTSKRLEKYGLHVVPGDIVTIDQERARQPIDPASSSISFSNASFVHVVRSEQEAREFSIHDVVLPVPYPGTLHSKTVFPETSLLSRQSFKDFAEKHHLAHLLAPLNSSTPLTACSETPKCTYRPIIGKPSNIQLSVLRDPSSLTTIKTDLFLLQERKPIEGFDLSYALRVREPCRYNVSEKFAARMKPIRSTSSGDKSVVISFYLPQECCPFIFLREAFDLRYGTFHDMLGLC